MWRENPHHHHERSGNEHNDNGRGHGVRSGHRPKRGDLHEIFVWEDGVKLDGDTLYYFQAIHQESDVIPENADAIRALMGTEADWKCL